MLFLRGPSRRVPEMEKLYHTVIPACKHSNDTQVMRHRATIASRNNRLHNKYNWQYLIICAVLNNVIS